MNTELPIGLLRTFSAVAEVNSFTLAGEALHITQSAVSMQMKRLEDVIGRPLFKKKGRSFSLTTAGEILQEHAHRILTAHNDALAAFLRPELNGRVRFGCAEDYATRFLPRILSDFRSDFPRIRVDIRSGPGRDLHRALDRKDLDICLIEGSTSGGRLVHREQVVWVTAGNSAAHRMDPLPLAVYDEGCAYRKWALEALQKKGRAHWIAFVSPSISSILAAVQAGLAVAPIGRSSLNDSLRLLSPDEGFPLLPVSEVSLHQAPTADNDAVSCFADYVAASFKKVDL